MSRSSTDVAGARRRYKSSMLPIPDSRAGSLSCRRGAVAARTARRGTRTALRVPGRATLVVMGALVALPTAAQASEVHVEGSVVKFTAGPGERNDLSVSLNRFEGDQNRFYVSDGGSAITVGAGCDGSDSFRGINCQMGPGASASADLGDQNDQAALGVPGAVLGGLGDDVLKGVPLVAQAFDGGPGNDKLNGDDTGYCTEAGSPRGPDALIGGDGIDTADYDSDTSPVNVTIDGAANDGAPGEGDNVGLDVENVIGTDCGANDITGSAAPNALTGQGVLSGLGGDDALTGSGSDDVLNGGDGNDKLTGRSGNDVLDGSAGDDFLEGGFDDDRLTGGPGKDSFVGDETASNTIGTGNDLIFADDGIGESVSCGPGSDTANLDGLDTVPVDTQNLCEIVNRSSSGAAPSGPAGPSAPSGPAAPAPAARSVSASALKLVSQRRKLRIKLTCVLKTQPGCNGTVKLLATSRRVTFSSPRTISLAPKAGRTFTLSLTKRGRALVKRSRKLSIVVQTSLRTATGVKTSRQTLTLRR